VLYKLITRILLQQGKTLTIDIQRCFMYAILYLEINVA